MTLAAFVAAWLLHLVAAASPGPAILMAARIGMTDGARTGVFLALGIGLGALFWAVSALFGLAILFQVAPALLWGFKVAGGLYLLWIAVGMWRHAAAPVSSSANGVARSPVAALRLGLVTQLSNPKPAVFFGAVFVGTVPPHATPLAMGLLLIAIFLNEVGCNIAVARLFSRTRVRTGYARLKAPIDRVFGSVLALLGMKIALT